LVYTILKKLDTGKSLHLQTIVALSWEVQSDFSTRFTVILIKQLILFKNFQTFPQHSLSEDNDENDGDQPNLQQAFKVHSQTV